MQADSALGRILAVVRLLRARVEWPARQSRESLRPYLVEETLELDQAVAEGDADAIRDEVGDLLLHVAFQIVIGEERGEFDAEAVVAGLEAKMRRRHPQAFDDTAPPPGWERAKARERLDGSVLAGLPRALPALLAAFRMQERAAGAGFDWPDASGPLDKVREELREVEEAVSRDLSSIDEEIGDLLFAVVNLSRKLGVAPTSALDRANRKFHRRFAAMERRARASGTDIWSLDLAQLDALWNQVKSTA